MEPAAHAGAMQLWIGCVAFCLLRTTCGSPGVGILGGSENGLPCVYEGHLKTDRDWFGYLANITIMTTGRMSFEFSYPADKCCQNVLFYQEEQMSIINARMNCWQKEALVMPEDDQILRLTPTFSWSGCHLSHPNGLPTYTCEGGRSFTSTTGGVKPTSWYIAVSNCHSLMGLDLNYRLLVVGHIGECKQPYRIATTTTIPPVPSPRVGQLGPENQAPQISGDKVCVIEGTLNTTINWYGFLSNVSLNRGGGFKFRFSYPFSMQVQNVIMYNMQDVTKLNSDQSCWQKEGVIRSRNVPEQIMDLSYRSSWNGCISKNGSGTRTLICAGQRRFDTPRRIYLAVSNCRSHSGVYLDYRFEVANYAGSLCSGASPQGYYTSFRHPMLLGVLSVILASVAAGR